MSDAEVEPLTSEEMEELGRRVAKFRSEYEGHVYAMRSGNFIKVGFTKRHIADRMGQLQTGSPVELRLLGIGPGGRYVERDLHTMLKPFRSHGEWYRDEPTVRDVIRPFFTTRSWI